MKLFRSSCSILSGGKLELLSNKAAPVRARCNELLFTLALSSHRPAGGAGQSRAWAAPARGGARDGTESSRGPRWSREQLSSLPYLYCAALVSGCSSLRDLRSPFTDSTAHSWREGFQNGWAAGKNH